MRPFPPSPRPPWVLALALVSACSDHTPVAPAGATPTRQFIFEGLRVEERDENGLSWIGTAKRASGDLDHADAEDIRIRHYPEGSSRAPVDILSPRGRLGFEDGRATLESVRIVTRHEGVITGGPTEYLGKENRALVQGPIALDAKGLRATATSAVVSLDEGSVEVQGPVVGRYLASRPTRASAAAPIPGEPPAATTSVPPATANGRSRPAAPGPTPRP